MNFIFLSRINAAQLRLYPNPVSVAGSTLYLYNLAEGQYVLLLTGMKRQLLARRTIRVRQPQQAETIQRGTLPAGLYWLTLLNEHQQKVGSLQLVVQ